LPDRSSCRNRSTDPLKYYHNNTAKSRALIAGAVAGGVPHIIFSSTAATYGIPEVSPVAEDSPKLPINPYGMSKLMTEIMLADTAAAHALNYCALRYFNVAGADPQARTGQSTAGATHLIKVAVEAALGKRGHVDVFGTDYARPMAPVCAITSTCPISPPRTCSPWRR
jgi:UDP-glucose 4-epimerase